MMNDALDWDALRETYNENKRIVIRDVLEPGFAEEVFHCLATEVAWELYYLTEQGPTVVSADELKNLSPQQRVGIEQKLTAMSGSGFSYFYFRAEMDITSYPVLKKFYDFLAGPEVLKFVKYVSGDESLDRMNVVATRYTPSCFLRTHNDLHDKDGRRVGHLWGFTHNWNPDWGGVLQFVDKDRRIFESHVPEFNTLTLFKIPVAHFVSQVAAFAQAPRFVLSGWFHDQPYPDGKVETAGYSSY